MVVTCGGGIWTDPICAHVLERSRQRPLITIPVGLRGRHASQDPAANSRRTTAAWTASPGWRQLAPPAPP